MKIFQKIPKNTSRCDESNDVKFSQKIRSFSIVCGDLKLNKKRAYKSIQIQCKSSKKTWRVHLD